MALRPLSRISLSESRTQVPFPEQRHRNDRQQHLPIAKPFQPPAAATTMATTQTCET